MMSGTISEIATVVGGGTPSTSKPEYWNGNINWYTPKEIQDNIFASKSERKITELGLNNSSAKMLPVNTLLFTLRATIGEMAILRTPGSTNQGFQSLILNDTCEPYFIYSLKEDIKTRAINKASGSTFLEISKNNVEKLNVNVPNKNEQKKLAKLFFEMDKLLCLKDKEIEKLKFYKKSMLENMFPQRGEDIPRIRFNGFEKAWNYLKLKDIYSISGSGGTPSTNNKSYYGGNIPFLSISDISEKGGRINKTEKNITKLGLNNSTARIFPKNTICLAMYASVGKVTVAGTPLATSQAFYNMYFENINTTKFVFQYLKYFNEIGGWIKYVSTGTQANLNAYKIKNFDIPIPSLEEQKLIGNFFYKLDKHIELKKDELEKLKEFKAALLDKMFV